MKNKQNYNAAVVFEAADGSGLDEINLFDLIKDKTKLLEYENFNENDVYNGLFKIIDYNYKTIKDTIKDYVIIELKQKISDFGGIHVDLVETIYNETYDEYKDISLDTGTLFN